MFKFFNSSAGGLTNQYCCSATDTKDATPFTKTNRLAKAIVNTIFLNLLKNQNVSTCIDYNVDPNLNLFQADTITGIYENIEAHLKDNQAFSNQDIYNLNDAIKKELTRYVQKSNCKIGISSILLLGSITAIGLNAGGVISCSPCFGVVGTIIKPYCILLHHKDKQRTLQIQIELTPRITPVITSQPRPETPMPIEVTSIPIENTTEESEA